MTDHTAKNLVGRDLLNLREALRSARPYVAEHANESPTASAVLARIDTLIYKHADPERDIALMWSVGDYRAYPVVEGTDLLRREAVERIIATVRVLPIRAHEEIVQHILREIDDLQNRGD